MNNFSGLLDSFPGCRIAVIGDLMLDEYIWGNMERISPEAPVPILRALRRSFTLGGAGNVIENLRSLGVEVIAIGVVGDDETGKQVRDLLIAHGADTTGVLTDARRQSTRKIRLMSLEHGQQVFRLDEESTSMVTGQIEEKIISAIHAMTSGIQAIVCSDYSKGVLSERILKSVFAAAHERGIRSIVAPKDTKAEKYKGANILMPNSRELLQLSSVPVASAVSLDDSARNLIEKLSLEALIVTRGREGLSLFEKSPAGLRRIDISTAARTVFDVTGAGDTAIAAFAAALSSGSDLESAAHLANITAGIKVGKRGTASVSVEEIRSALKTQ